MLLVVALHAALAYTQLKIPNLLWTVREPSSHLAFDVFCWWALGISSPFYLMSGFFAADLYQARGPRTFLKSRLKRIVVPFLAASLFLLPAIFCVWAVGWVISGECSFSEIRRMKFHTREIQRNLYGPAHLWSLEYLIVMLFGYWVLQGLRRLVGSWKPNVTSGPFATNRFLLSLWAPLLLAVPTTFILWVGLERVGLDAMMDRQNSFLPEPFRLLHNVLFFAVGVMLHRSRHDLGRLIPHGATYLALSVPVFACRAWLIRQDLQGHMASGAKLALAMSGALFTWLTTFGFLSLSQRLGRRPLPVLRYLADSSYWIYLYHLPIIGLLQVDLAQIQAVSALKFLVVLVTTLGLGFSSYHFGVRYTMLGTWLHGPRRRPWGRGSVDSIRIPILAFPPCQCRNPE
jgi:peptidoglycan/LPS O-acetylase OafA/YrhL